MSAPQLTANGEHGASVSPTTQAHLGHQPPETFHAVAVDWEPCRLQHGCYLLAHGTVCGEICHARLMER